MLALVLALGAGVAWGGSDFLAGLASRRLPVLAVLVGSQAAGLVLLLGLLGVTGGTPPAAGSLAPAAAAGVAELLGFAALYKSLALGPMSVVSPISALAGLVPFSAALAAGERPPVAACAGMALALLGAAAASAQRGGRRPGGVAPGAVLAAVAAVCFGVFLLATDAAAHAAGPAWAVAVNRATSVSLLALAVAFARPRMARRPAVLVAVAGVGLLDAAANAMFAFAVMRGLTSTVSVLGSLYPVVTVALAALLLGERLAPLQAAGVTGVLAGVALVGAHP